MQHTIQVKWATALALLSLPALTWAGTPINGIDYQPLREISAVPTLSEWGLALLVLMVTVIGYRVARSRGAGRLFSALWLAAGAGAMGYFGHGAVQPAMADVPSSHDMTSQGGGTVS